MSLFASRTNQWNFKHNALEQARDNGVNVLDLTQSNPTVAGLSFPYDLSGELSDAQALRYDPQSFGMMKTREAVKQYYAHRGYSLDIKSILLTSSSSESYAHLLRLLVNPHEKVLIPAPSYPLFPFLLDIHDVAYDTYQLKESDDWRIDREDLLRRLDKSVKAIMLVHPNNPTGSSIKAEDRAWLIQIAQQHQIALIVDEVFIDYASDHVIESFVTVGDCLTFVLGGLSKTLCLPQMKLGWLITSGPKDLVEEALARLEIMADTYLSVNTPVQVASCKWLPRVDQIQSVVKQRLNENWRYLSAHIKYPLTVKKPEAGWYVLVQISEEFDDEQFALELIKKGVQVYPGYYFDLASDHYVVISLLTEPAIFQKGWEILCQQM